MNNNTETISKMSFVFNQALLLFPVYAFHISMHSCFSIEYHGQFASLIQQNNHALNNNLVLGFLYIYLFV